MILDDIKELARRLNVDTEIPSGCRQQIGYLYSEAGFILSRVEEELHITRPKGQLGERYQYALCNANNAIGRNLGFDEESGTSFGRSGIKKSHRAEGLNYVD